MTLIIVSDDHLNRCSLTKNLENWVFEHDGDVSGEFFVTGIA